MHLLLSVFLGCAPKAESPASAKPKEGETLSETICLIEDAVLYRSIEDLERNPIMSYQAAKSLKQRWFIKEAYPLYAVIGAGSLAAAAMLTRTFFFNPDTKYIKQYRSEDMLDDDREVKRGSSFYDHPIRRAVRGYTIGILPNSMFTKPKDEEE